MSDTNPKLTITLTGKPPVTIVKEDWPVIAEALDSEYDGEYEFQAIHKTRWALRVRQHNDGRAIIYGSYRYESAWRGAREYNERAGELLAQGEDIPATIDRVGRIIASFTKADDAERWPHLIAQCIANLPAVELS